MIRLFKILYEGGYYAQDYEIPIYDSRGRLHNRRRPIYDEDNIYMSRSSAEATMLAMQIKRGGDERYYINADHNYRPSLSVVEMTPLEVVKLMQDHGLYRDKGKNIWRAETFWTVSGNPFYMEAIPVFRTEQGMVEFWDVDAERFTTMKPGKFLKKYMTNITDREIDYQASYFKTGERPPLEIKLKFAYTPEEMLHVYKEGPQSCMKGSESVVAYAGGDLALAYAVFNDRIMGRVLCWPEKKIYGRIYPNDGSWDTDGFRSHQESVDLRATMEKMLRSDGYHSLSERPAGFDGARLKKVVVAVKQEVHMPYLDLDMRINYDKDGNLIMAKDGILSSSNTSGTMEFSEKSCKVCVEATVLDQGHHHENSLYDSWTNGRNARNAAPVCPVCRQKAEEEGRIFHCENITGRKFLLAEGQKPVLAAIRQYADAASERHNKTAFHPDDPDLWQCAVTKRHYHANWTTPVITVDGRKVNQYSYRTIKGYHYAIDDPKVLEYDAKVKADADADFL